MDIELPNGVVIKDIPEGTSKEQIMQKAIKNGLATAEDFQMGSALVEDFSLGQQQQVAQPMPYKSPSMGDKLVGAGETALTLLTGATGGLFGTVGGGLTGAYEEAQAGRFGTPEAAKRIEQRAALGAQRYTYEPRTQASQEQLQSIGNILQMVPPQPGMAPGLFSNKVPNLRQGANIVRNAFEEAPMLPRVEPTMGASAGAAAASMPLVRETTATALPVPVTLTRGARTRDAAQLAFEKEQMKGPLGAPLRERSEQNNLEILKNFDTLIEETGAQVAQAGPAATGNKVIDALSQGWNGAKAKTRAAYTKAENAGELQAPVVLDSLADYINQNMPEASVAPVLNLAKNKGIQLGVLEQLEDGSVRALPADLRTTELLRRSIGNTIGTDPTNQLFGGKLKEVIDISTEGLGGDLYKEARTLRNQQARKFEGRAVVANLLTKVKGKDDPKIEASEVFQKSILNGSPEEITFLKRVLFTSGKDGQTAWNEVQGSTMKHIVDEATGGIATDSMGNRIVSPAKLNSAIQGLDKNGRLDIVLGKQKAQTVRDLNEVLQYIQTVPPGTLINSSGTAGMLMAAITEAGLTGYLTGLPVPVLSGIRVANQYVKDRKLKARIENALSTKD
jgi:hypothetical protein